MQTGLPKKRALLTEEGFLLEQGNQRFLLGDYQGAIADYSKAIDLNPTNAHASYSRGLACLGADQKDRARKDLMRARELGCHVPHEALDLCKQGYVTEETVRHRPPEQSESRDPHKS